MNAKCAVLLVLIAVGFVDAAKDGDRCDSLFGAKGYYLGDSCYRPCNTDPCLIGTCYKVDIKSPANSFNVCIFSTILSWMTDDTDDPNIRISRANGLTCFGSLDWSPCVATWVASGICVAGNCYADCSKSTDVCTRGAQKCLTVKKDGKDSHKICSFSSTFAKWRTMFDYSDYDFSGRVAAII